MNEVGENVRAQYDDYYGSDELAEWRRLGAIDKVDNIRELSRELKINSVVDIGCGDGSIIERLASLNFAAEYHGFDISSSAIEAARAKGIRGARFCTFDGGALPLQPGQVDLAVMSHVVEHLEHPRFLIREAQRVASAVVVEVPCEHTLRLSRDYIADSVGHINFYTPTTIRRLVQSCGLTVEKQITRDCSLAVMRFNRPWLGVLQFAARKTALTLSSSVAPAVFVYHTALLCR